jgi:predicted methyltransferase
MILPSILESARSLIARALPTGGIAVDGTVGNGHDTLFLAERVGERGMVYGFDIQEEALASARRRLEEAGCFERVRLFLRGHEEMDEVLPPELKGRVHAAMFNLGYLPHGNPAIITRPDTTVQALTHALEWLAPGGMLTAVLYTGHPGGQEEAEQVLAWAGSLSPKLCQVMWQQLVNRRQAPSLLAVEKR